MIRPPNEGIEVWLCVEPVDFRKQIPGLAALVQGTLAMDPFSTHLFVFTNRRPHPVSKHGRGAWPNGRNPSGRYRSNKTGCRVSSKVNGPEDP